MLTQEDKHLIAECKRRRIELRRERQRLCNRKNPRYLPKDERARVDEIDRDLEQYSNESLAEKFECGYWAIKNV